MIEFYSAHWEIESELKEIKQDIGALDSQCRNSLAVENHFDLCCFAMSLTWIYAFKPEQAPEVNTLELLLSLISAKISQELAREHIFQGMPGRTHTHR